MRQRRRLWLCVRFGAGIAAAEHVPVTAVTPATTASRVRHRGAAAVAVLLVAAAALLILGVLLERHNESGAEHPIVAATGEQAEGHHSEPTEATRAQPHGGGDAAERLTGISTESPWIVALGSIASIA